jgi:hypothetical protein
MENGSLRRLFILSAVTLASAGRGFRAIPSRDREEAKLVWRQVYATLHISCNALVLPKTH